MYGSCVRGVFGSSVERELLRQSTMRGDPGSTASIGHCWKSAQSVIYIQDNVVEYDQIQKA